MLEERVTNEEEEQEKGDDEATGDSEPGAAECETGNGEDQADDEESEEDLAGARDGCVGGMDIRARGGGSFCKLGGGEAALRAELAVVRDRSLAGGANHAL